MPTPRQEFFGGLCAELPIIIGVFPFGLIFGALAIQFGVPALIGQAMSSVMFGGSAQFISTPLLAVGTPALVVILTVFVVNARHALAIDRDRERTGPFVEEHLEERRHRIAILIEHDRIVDFGEQRLRVEQPELANERAHHERLDGGRLLREALAVDEQQPLVPLRRGDLQQQPLADAALALHREHDLVRMQRRRCTLDRHRRECRRRFTAA